MTQPIVEVQRFWEDRATPEPVRPHDVRQGAVAVARSQGTGTVVVLMSDARYR